MVSVRGRQIIAEFKCSNKKVLNDAKKLEKTLVDAAVKNGFSVKTKIHRFTPQGITAIAILSESHAIIHTWPEENHLSMDVYVCSGDPNKMVDYIRKALSLKLIEQREFARGEEIYEANWQAGFLTAGLNINYHIKKHLFRKKSKYQQIDIIENDYFGRMLFLDRDLQIAESDAKKYNKTIVLPIVGRGGKLNNVLVLGGGDGGIADELLQQGAKRVVLVDIDEEVVQACKKFMPKVWGAALNSQKVRVITGNAFDYLKRAGGFDAVIYDLTWHPEAVARISGAKFMEGIFSNIKNCLRKNGIVTMQCCPEVDKETFSLINRVLKKYFKDIRFVKSFIPSYCANWVFASARRP